MHEVLVNRLGGLSLPRKSVVRLTDRPDMTLDVYHGRKTTMQQQYNNISLKLLDIFSWNFTQMLNTIRELAEHMNRNSDFPNLDLLPFVC